MNRGRDEVQHVGRQMLSHFIDPSHLELRLWARSGWRQKIQANDRIEIWAGLKLVGQLSGDAMHSLVTHHLAGAALGAHLLEQMATLRTPRTIDPESDGAIPLPVEPAMLSRKSIRREEKYARARERAPVKVECGAVVAETGRVCTGNVPCRYHPKKGAPR